MTDGPDQRVVDAWVRLIRTARLLLDRVEGDLKREGLPPLPWYDALLELRRAGEDGLRPFELERTMLLAQHNLSRLVDRLEKAGLLTKRPCPEDGRGQILAITGAGRDLLRRMWPVYAAAIERHLGARLEGAEAETLVGILDRLRPVTR